jgi:hypothetical protein
VVAPCVAAVFARTAAVKIFPSSVPEFSFEFDGFVVVEAETSGAALPVVLGTKERKEANKEINATLKICPKNFFVFIYSQFSIYKIRDLTFVPMPKVLQIPHNFSSER